MKFLYKILDYLLMPFRYLKFVAMAPIRVRKRKENWRTFQAENYDRIKNWMITHPEGDKLPIYRDDHENFHWVNRAHRKQTKRKIKKYLEKNK